MISTHPCTSWRTSSRNYLLFRCESGSSLSLTIQSQLTHLVAVYQIYWSSLMIYCEYLSFLDLVQNYIKAWLIIQFSFFSKSRNCLKDTSKRAHVFKWPTYNWNWSVSTLKVKHLETCKIEQQHVTTPSPLLPSFPTQFSICPGLGLLLLPPHLITGTLQLFALQLFMLLFT